MMQEIKGTTDPVLPVFLPRFPLRQKWINARMKIIQNKPIKMNYDCTIFPVCTYNFFFFLCSFTHHLTCFHFRLLNAKKKWLLWLAVRSLYAQAITLLLVFYVKKENEKKRVDVCYKNCFRSKFFITSTLFFAVTFLLFSHVTSEEKNGA